MVKIHHFIVINIVGCCCHYVTIIRGFTRHDMQTILTRQANFDLLIGIKLQSNQLQPFELHH